MKIDRMLGTCCFAFFLLGLVVIGGVEAQEETSSVTAKNRVKLDKELKEEIHFFVDLLDSGNPYVDDTARVQLIQLGSTAVPVLLDRLDDVKPRKQYLLAEILGQIRDARAVPALIDLLDDFEANPSIASAAASALGHIADRRAISPLIEALESPDTELTYNAIEALGILRAKKAEAKIISYIDSEKSTFYEMRIGNAALLAVGKLRSREALDEIRTILTSDIRDEKEGQTGWPVKLYAVRALEQIALQTKGPVMSDQTADTKDQEGEDGKKKKTTVEKWVDWINEEIGEPEEEQGEGEEEKEENKEDGEEESDE